MVVEMETLETVWQGIAGWWTRGKEQDCVQGGIDVDSRGVGCVGECGMIVLEDDASRLRTDGKEVWWWGGGEAGFADAEVYGNDSGSWKGGFPDFETQLDWELFEKWESGHICLFCIWGLEVRLNWMIEDDGLGVG